MYDDLLGPRKKKGKTGKTGKKPGLRVNLLNNAPGAKPANPDKFPSHESARNQGSVSSCSDTCDCDGDCEGHQDGPGITPKDPWADVGEDEDEDFDLSGLVDDEEDCPGDCDTCPDEDCKQIDNEIEAQLEELLDEDDEIEPSQDIGC